MTAASPALSVEDRFAIAEVVRRYAAYVDDRRCAEAAALFTEDAQLVVPSPPHSNAPVDAHDGRDAIEQALRRVLRLDTTVHEIVGHVIDADDDPDRARGRTACVAHHFTRGADDEWFIRYEDDYVRTASGWRFARRAYTLLARRVTEVRYPRDEAAG